MWTKWNNLKPCRSWRNKNFWIRITLPKYPGTARCTELLTLLPISNIYSLFKLLKFNYSKKLLTVQHINDNIRYKHFVSLSVKSFEIFSLWRGSWPTLTVELAAGNYYQRSFSLLPAEINPSQLLLLQGAWSKSSPVITSATSDAI